MLKSVAAVRQLPDRRGLTAEVALALAGIYPAPLRVLTNRIVRFSGGHNG
jgi:hypothetical protein